jgi:hypothetical protein
MRGLLSESVVGRKSLSQSRDQNFVDAIGKVQSRTQDERIGQRRNQTRRKLRILI